jgi:phospholipase/carboxylesterase
MVIESRPPFLDYPAAMALTAVERPAGGDPVGLVVLHHGRGSDEQDLIELADVFDPEQRLHVVAPRAPLQLPGSPGYHWYLVHRVGYPDPDGFQAASRELAAFHDALWERTGIGPERTVLGGFSMGTVMSYALGLGGERPAPAGILALSGFIPTVEGWAPDLARSDRTRVLIAHGRQDPVIPVTFARRARELLEQAGFAVDYRESDAAHHVDPADVVRVMSWLGATLDAD